MQELLLGGKHVYIHTVGITEETGDGSLSPDAPMPLVLHMSHRGDGSEIVEELLKEDLPPFYLAAVSLPSLLWAGLPVFERYRREKGVPYSRLYCESWADRLGSRYRFRRGQPLTRVNNRRDEKN